MFPQHLIHHQHHKRQEQQTAQTSHKTTQATPPALHLPLPPPTTVHFFNTFVVIASKPSIITRAF